MTIFIHSAPSDAWYSDLVGAYLDNVWIGWTGHYHVYESFDQVTLLVIDYNDAIHS